MADAQLQLQARIRVLCLPMQVSRVQLDQGAAKCV